MISAIDQIFGLITVPINKDSSMVHHCKHTAVKRDQVAICFDPPELSTQLTLKMFIITPLIPNTKRPTHANELITQ
jgi:hypothetical protein